MKSLPVLKAIRSDVYTCAVGDRLATIAARMADQEISTVVVVDSMGRLLGVVTRTDLIRACHENDEWQGMTASEVMTRGVVTVTAQDTLGYVGELMLRNRIHRVVIVRREDHGLYPLSVISTADMVHNLANET